MKALFVLILAVVACFAGYRFAYDELVKVVDLSIPVEKPDEAPAPVVAEVAPVAPKPVVVAPKVVVAPTPPPAMEAPKIAITGGLGMTEVDPDGFVPPKFQTIEEITKDWKEIPKSIFKNQPPVKIAKDVNFKMGAGAMAVKAGATAFAVGQEGGMIVIAPSKDSPGRADIALEDTDLKAVISSTYSSWKVNQLAFLKKQHTSKIVVDKELVSKPKGKPLGPNTKPVRNSDGTYAVLLDSMKAGQVREITPQNIKKWSDATQETIDGKEYWSVLVNYTTKTMFGDFDVEAQARIFGGKVEKWVYTGSGEVVP